jgi:hypothetical protein
MIGFEQSAWVRLAAGLLFCAAAAGLVWLVERTPEPATIVHTEPVGDLRRFRLAVESSYPVAQWSVSVLGALQQAESSDAFRWNGTVAIPAGEEVLVQAAAAAATAGSPHRALRLRLGDAPERLVWGSGDLASTVAAP